MTYCGMCIVSSTLNPASTQLMHALLRVSNHSASWELLSIKYTSCFAAEITIVLVEQLVLDTKIPYDKSTIGP